MVTLELLPSSGTLAVEVDGRVSCYADAGQRIDLRARPGGARVVRLGQTTFYQRARRKLRITDSAEIPAPQPGSGPATASDRFIGLHGQARRLAPGSWAPGRWGMPGCQDTGQPYSRHGAGCVGLAGGRFPCRAAACGRRAGRAGGLRRRARDAGWPAGGRRVGVREHLAGDRQPRHLPRARVAVRPRRWRGAAAHGRHRLDPGRGHHGPAGTVWLAVQLARVDRRRIGWLSGVRIEPPALPRAEPGAGFRRPPAGMGAVTVAVAAGLVPAAAAARGRRACLRRGRVVVGGHHLLRARRPAVRPGVPDRLAVSARSA